MLPLVALGVGALLLFAAGGSRSGARGGQVACTDTPRAVASRSRATLITWVTCQGRTQADVDALADIVRRAGRRRDADAIQRAYREHIARLNSPATGTLADPEEDRAAMAIASAAAPPPPPPAPPTALVTFPGLDDIERTDAPSGSGGGFSPAEARRLAPQVARTIRSGGGYRGSLRRFQSAAGLTVDGAYGPRSRAALRYYGVSDPPPAIANRGGVEEYTPPAIRTDEVVVSGALDMLRGVS